MGTWLSLLFLFGWKTDDISAAKILGLMPTPSPSHHIWNRALMLALAERGHEVTVISPDPEKHPVANYTDIVIEEAYERINDSGFNYESMSTQTFIENSLIWFQWGQDACEFGIASKGAKKLMALQGKETFDVIIIDLGVEECFLGFVPLFNNPPVIAITAYGSPPWFNTIVGNPQILSFTSSYILPFTDHMTFLQRMVNFVLHNVIVYYRTFHHLPNMDNIAQKYFGNSAPLPSEIEKNISLVMVNTHFSVDFPRPLVPAMIPVGGMHIKPGKELPSDLKNFLDNANNGAIFFSLGTNVRSDKMSAVKLKAFLDAFSELPQRVLWKWESDTLPGQPKNVMLGKWLPQNDILAHPNIHLFMSHAGMLSSQEAIYHGVPVVGIPFLADQFVNIVKLATHGLGVELVYDTLSKQTILDAVHTVLGNHSYRDNMKKLSAIYRDQQETPLQRAVFWTEYVLRHGGSSLRSVSADLTWYQYFLIDVIAVLIIGISLIFVLLYLALRKIYRTVAPVTRITKSKQQ
ncbi:UDP-glucuronosyltransferase 2B31 isoform X3 [Cryptotermes secundus]|nr:UDP-glucuronosyltransferase 2B31 isoform X3 [Cryptotermes secundus]